MGDFTKYDLTLKIPTNILHFNEHFHKMKGFFLIINNPQIFVYRNYCDMSRHRKAKQRNCVHIHNNKGGSVLFVGNSNALEGQNLGRFIKI
jgi:hypothetical protein